MATATAFSTVYNLAGNSARKAVSSSANAKHARVCLNRSARLNKQLAPRVHGRHTVSRKQQRCRVAAVAETAAPASAPPPAETARTIVELVGSGTLSSLDSSGTPLGTYVTYVLDKNGFPVLRLRKDAVHTQNLQANASCSLFVHAPLQPVRSVARITLIGSVEPVSEEERAEAQAQHTEIHADAIGVDAPQEDDVFMRLNVTKTFYVGGLGSVSSAEEIPVDEYTAAETDTLKEDAPALVAYVNSERPLDAVRIAGDMIEDGDMDDVEAAELVWIDRLGVYIRAIVKGQERILRVNFTHSALDERDAKSCLTMMAQVAWENERSYQPSPIPSPTES